MQNDLFDFPKLKITKKIRLIELFGGIGSQAMALRDIGADFEHYRLVEFDKYAVASYNAIHGTNFKPTDIRNVHGLDMGIENKQSFTYLLIPLRRPFSGRQNARYEQIRLGKRQQHKKRLVMGS